MSLQLGRGEVLAVIGENGAGKSTLMKILAGIQSPDRGELRVEGRRVALDSVTAATEAGIVLIHQELNLADNLTVSANIFLGREPRRWGWIDQTALDRRASQALARVGLSVSPHQPLKKLTIGKQQLVEIAKALSIDARILIMDEPTSSLSGREAEQLFRLVKELRAQGMSVIYISHRLG
ncbi:MAG: ATP-binding cassette domain-containing protein, partial [Pirellulaceae bacterium]